MLVGFWGPKAMLKSLEKNPLKLRAPQGTRGATRAQAPWFGAGNFLLFGPPPPRRILRSSHYWYPRYNYTVTGTDTTATVITTITASSLPVTHPWPRSVVAPKGAGGFHVHVALLVQQLGLGDNL